MKTRALVLLLAAALSPVWGDHRAEATTIVAPASITVPASDADGAYTVKWKASTLAGCTYLLQEARDPLFTAGLRSINAGKSLSRTITGRAARRTYFYRVLARHAGEADSLWRVGGNGCAVPGTVTAARPGALTVPGSDDDGAYALQWDASATAGAIYELQEADNDTFTSDRRVAYIGPLLSLDITGRTGGATYYYRVRALKAGLKNSAWRVGINGCDVADPCGVPVTWGGLEWQKCGSPDGMNWAQASTYCADLNEGGHSDWRLPTMEELRGLIVCTNGTVVTGGYPDGAQPNWCGDGNADPFAAPTIDSGFSCESDIYWSSSAYTGICDPDYGCDCAAYGGCAWGVNFQQGDTNTFHFVTHNSPVRCLRDLP